MMDYDSLRRSAAVHFFIRYKDKQFAHRRMFLVPRVGDLCVFDEVRYRVEVVEWCLDTDATEVGVRVNVEMVPNVELTGGASAPSSDRRERG